MTEKEIFTILKESKRLPSLPQVLQELLHVAGQKELSARQLAKVIKKDPSITAQLLRLVNSPRYHHRGKISSINFAVAQLGPRAVIAMAFSAVIFRVLGNESHVFDRVKLWRHSLETAILCREIAVKCAYHPPEEAFVLGLMHDLGLILMESLFPDHFKDVCHLLESGSSMMAAEEKIFNTNHARIGQFLADHWNLPKFMGEAIGMHHLDFSELRDNHNSKLSLIVNMGNRLTKFPAYTLTKSDIEAMKKVNLFSDTLGISSIEVMHLQSRAMEEVQHEAKYLELEIGSPADLLEESHNLLYAQYSYMENILAENIAIQKEASKNKADQQALDSYKSICDNLVQYLNMTNSSLLGGAQLMQLAIQKGRVIDKENIAANYLDLVNDSVKTIAHFTDELKKINDQTF
jgi:HD-like signal output (HDOD) protein